MTHCWIGLIQQEDGRVLTGKARKNSFICWLWGTFLTLPFAAISLIQPDKQTNVH